MASASYTRSYVQCIYKINACDSSLFAPFTVRHAGLFLLPPALQASQVFDPAFVEIKSCYHIVRPLQCKKSPKKPDRSTDPGGQREGRKCCGFNHSEHMRTCDSSLFAPFTVRHAGLFLLPPALQASQVFDPAFVEIKSCYHIVRPLQCKKSPKKPDRSTDPPIEQASNWDQFGAQLYTTSIDWFQ